MQPVKMVTNNAAFLPSEIKRNRYCAKLRLTRRLLVNIRPAVAPTDEIWTLYSYLRPAKTQPAYTIIYKRRHSRLHPHFENTYFYKILPLRFRLIVSRTNGPSPACHQN